MWTQAQTFSSINKSHPFFGSISNKCFDTNVNRDKVDKVMVLGRESKPDYYFGTAWNTIMTFLDISLAILSHQLLFHVNCSVCVPMTFFFAGYVH